MSHHIVLKVSGWMPRAEGTRALRRRTPEIIVMLWWWGGWLRGEWMVENCEVKEDGLMGREALIIVRHVLVSSLVQHATARPSHSHDVHAYDLFKP